MPHGAPTFRVWNGTAKNSPQIPALRGHSRPYAREAGVKHQETSYAAIMMMGAMLAMDTRRTRDGGCQLIHISITESATP